MLILKNLPLALGLAGFLVVGCTGPQGPSGPAGSAGPTAFQTSFQNGVSPNSSYSGEVDTWLNGSTSSPMNSSPYLEVNTGAGVANYGRVVVRFDVSSLPTNSTVFRAEVWLKLESATSVGSSPVTIGCHNFASSTFAGCQWNGGASWLLTGVGGNFQSCTGDGSAGQTAIYNPTVLSSAIFSSSVNGTSGVYKWDCTSVVQSWVSSPASNNGLLFRSEGEFSEAASSVGFHPYNDSTAANRPLLIVEYQ